MMILPPWVLENAMAARTSFIVSKGILSLNSRLLDSPDPMSSFRPMIAQKNPIKIKLSKMQKPIYPAAEGG